MTTVCAPVSRLQPQKRDLNLLCFLYQSRFLTLKHAADLCFEGKLEAAKKRIQKLKLAKLIASRHQRVHEPGIVFLTEEGLRLLRSDCALCQLPNMPRNTVRTRLPPSGLALNHDLQVLDVKAAFYRAVRNNAGVAINEFSTLPDLHKFKALRVGQMRQLVCVKPDGFMRLSNAPAAQAPMEHIFFIELDRSTETQETLALRLGSYLEYYKSGRFAARNGASATEYRVHPFRVLIVFKTAERRNNTAARLLELNPPVLTQAWLSTFDEVTNDPLGKVWLRPIDYLVAVKGTEFEPGTRRGQSGYRRQNEREILVEQTVKKSAILCSQIQSTIRLAGNAQ